ncbi:hypothetical protein RO787_28370 [Blautia coccoides]|uniref:hypothetical protein n=1 Tax=Blautia producta TaxID=33035 RepID=UPI0028A30ED6|nr:hypothetical protein [Blautia coccoides]MDT4377235.1 hypothetical protein [Blautia coccoides]
MLLRLDFYWNNIKKIAIALVFCVIFVGCGHNENPANQQEDLEQRKSEGLKDPFQDNDIADNNLVKKVEYDLDEGDTLTLGIESNDGENEFIAIGHIANSEKASTVFLYLQAMSVLKKEDYKFNFFIECNDGSIGLMPNGEVVGFDESGEAFQGFPDWLVQDSSKIDKENFANITIKVSDCIDYFIGNDK